ncbi:MAG: hypothetical protein J7L82_02285 [Staphylothermus sp.]|nr:hypothetical protein [Staphylothermus sp.]
MPVLPTELQRVLLEIALYKHVIKELEDLKKHCDCPYIDERIKQLQQKIEQITKQYIEKHKR